MVDKNETGGGQNGTSTHQLSHHPAAVQPRLGRARSDSRRQQTGESAIELRVRGPCAQTGAQGIRAGPASRPFRLQLNRSRKRGRVRRARVEGVRRMCGGATRRRRQRSGRASCFLRDGKEARGSERGVWVMCSG